MRITRCFKAGNVILGAALFSGLGFIAPVTAQELPQERAYFIDLSDRSVTELGSLGGGYASPRALNDSGQVVGVSRTVNGQFHAFITGPDGVEMRDLGIPSDYSYASDINDSGQVVGESNTSADAPLRAFITGPNGEGMRDLGIPGDYSYASGINDAGQVVGHSPNSNGIPHPFITGANGEGMTLLGTLGGTLVVPGDVNSQGQVVGYSFTWGGPPTYEGTAHGFITGPNGTGMTDLGTLGGETSYAMSINNSGQVVGYSDTASGATRAFIIGPDDVGMRDLGTLGGGLIDVPYDINDAGQVVGRSRMSGVWGPDRAFIAGPDGYGMTDLNSVVNLPDGVVLTEATGINNLGQVIAIGVIPEPESYILFLAGLGLIGFMARRKRVLI
ncbi:PEP-CTERM protein-sorting domain-containing protein [Nitrosospira sp. Nsp14]|uniref:HAF repeat-containing PEP-CTERM protein n=1 Tax=Nitrosospira sp. Nsp14 TaxID=1855333 RepID=UPI0008F2963E|nr:HAF repeat-containing PEP-CTERM protein [Nitrosospira sp. Nsp14]SFH42909.1 PEP-CTERM protein-sorting domain-containing protein [Nitrosospira sp. Nsp14]